MSGWAYYRQEYRPYVPPPKAERECGCGTKDKHGRRPIGWCGPGCWGRPMNGRHARKA